MLIIIIIISLLDVPALSTILAQAIGFNVYIFMLDK